MATKNFTAGADWELLANDTDDPVLVSSQAVALVEFATSASDDEPEVSGHVLQMGIERDALSARAAGMEGYLFARSVSGDALVLVVDGSTVGDDEGGE
jgi:hypothetical protein